MPPYVTCVEYAMVDVYFGERGEYCALSENANELDKLADVLVGLDIMALIVSRGLREEEVSQGVHTVHVANGSGEKTWRSEFDVEVLDVSERHYLMKSW